MASQVEPVHYCHPDFDVSRTHGENPGDIAADVSVWSEDEHRIGLQPVMRLLWVVRGQQPVAQVNWKGEGLWLYGFVSPQSGETKAWILPCVRTDIFSAVLFDFANHFEIGSKKRVILVIDLDGI